MFKIRRRTHGGASSPNEAETFASMHRQLVRSILFTARFLPKYQRMLETFQSKCSAAQLVTLAPISTLELHPSFDALLAHALSHDLITKDEAHQLLDGQAITLETTGKEA